MSGTPAHQSQRVTVAARVANTIVADPRDRSVPLQQLAEYLIVVDYYCKFPFVRKMPTPCTSHAVVAPTADIFSEHGVPEKVVSDNGPHYDCVNYKKFAQEWGFEHVTSSPHFPQSNGFVERSIQTVKRTLLKANESNMNPCHPANCCMRGS